MRYPSVLKCFGEVFQCFVLSVWAADCCATLGDFAESMFCSDNNESAPTSLQDWVYVVDSKTIANVLSTISGAWAASLRSTLTMVSKTLDVKRPVHSYQLMRQMHMDGKQPLDANRWVVEWVVEWVVGPLID